MPRTPSASAAPDYTKLPIRVLRAKPIMSDAETEKLLGTFLTPDAVKTLIEESTDVFDAATGDCLLKFRKGVAAQRMVDETYDCLKDAAELTDNRGLASGRMNFQQATQFLKSTYPGSTLVWPEGEEFVHRIKYKKRDGTVSSISRALMISSGVVGFMERSPRFPYCRMTAYTQRNFAKPNTAHCGSRRAMRFAL